MENFDVLIIGAGISGIGSAYHLQDKCPGKTYAILESRDAVGGTWDLFRYPGVRSDSDMYTLGFSFKPWCDDKSIALGDTILDYVREAATENNIVRHIRFGHRMQSADWDSNSQRWTVTAEHNGEAVQLSCTMLLMCSGYYNYDEPHAPQFAGQESFAGTLVHPQHWPTDLDYQGKRVIVIGSGATAMTLVPAMAEHAEHVTMVQRSPTYVVSRPDKDKIAITLRKYLPDATAYALTRMKNVALQRFFYGRSRKAPERIKKLLLSGVRQALGPDYDIDTHFTPRYNPWDQRLCLIPNADLFKSIRSGKTEVRTGDIECMTPTGLKMCGDDEELPADIIVTATGLSLLLLGGATFSVDGEAIDFTETFTYKGMMYADVPNLVQTFGYVNASWTLRADLTAEYACRLINRMDELGVQQVTPQLRATDQSMQVRPWIDDFTPSYMQRVMHLFPKQGDDDPWRNTQNYALDKRLIRKAPLEDGALRFGATTLRPGAAARLQQQDLASAA